MASSDYKKINREVKGYVEVVYDVKNSNNSNIYTDLSISRNPNYTFNYSLTKADYSQSLNDSYLTQRVANKYAMLCNNLTKLDGSFILFNKVSNNNGFYSQEVIDYYNDYIESQGYSPRDFVLQIGKRNDLIADDIYGLSIYTINNNIIVSSHGNQIYGEVYNEEGDLIETTSDIKFYDSLHGGNQLLITFENSLNNCYVMLKGFEFEYTDRPAIITHIDLGISHVYQNEELIEFTVTEEVDKLVENTPANELSLTVGDYNMLYDPLNPKGIAKYLTENSIFVPYIGITNENNYMEYTKMGEFYFNKIDYNDKQVTFTTYNLIYRFSTEDFDDKFTTEHPNLNPHGTWDYGFGGYNSLTNIFQNCSDYSIRDNSKSSNYFDMVSYFYPPLTENLNSARILKLIGDYAICNNCILYVDRDNMTIIENINNEIKDKISKSELLYDIKYINIPKIKKIKVESPIPQYVQGALSETTLKRGAIIYQGMFKLKSTEEMHFIERKTAANVTVTSSNPNVTAILSTTSSTRYLGELVLQGSVGDETIVTITLTQDTTTYDYSSKDNYTLDIIGEEEVNISVDLSFQPNSSTGNDILKHYKDNYPTYRVNFDYNGNPLIQAGTYIEVESNYGIIPIFVTKHKLKYNGGLSGSIEGVE